MDVMYGCNVWRITYCRVLQLSWCLDKRLLNKASVKSIPITPTAPSSLLCTKLEM